MRARSSDLVFENVLQFEQGLDAIFGRRASPFGKSGSSSLNRGSGLGSAAESGVWAITSPVAGLVTSIHSVALESIHWPLMKFGTLVRVGGSYSHKFVSRIL